MDKVIIKGVWYKMLREISLDGWEKSGEGNNAVSYNNINDDTILLKLAKTNRRAVEAMENELDVIDKAMKLNIDTPKLIEKVQHKGSKGMIYERIQNKKSLGRLCHDNPENIKRYAKDYAREVAKLHSIKCVDIGLKNYKEFYIKRITDGTQDKKYTKKIIELIKNETNECDTFIHGDLTVGNFIYADNKWYWIDLGKMGCGDPIFDLINIYYSFNVLSSFGFIKKLFHMTKKQLIELWDNFIKEYAYLTNQNQEELMTRIKRLSVMYFFNIWATAPGYIPILYNIVHYNARKYYDEIIGN